MIEIIYFIGIQQGSPDKQQYVIALTVMFLVSSIDFDKEIGRHKRIK